MNELIEYETLKKVLSLYMSEEELSLIDKYYQDAEYIYKDMKRRTGEDYIYHPLGVAYILANLKMDTITIGSALIHEAVVLDKMNIEEIEEKYGSETSSILASVSKISSIKKTLKRETSTEHDRRILVNLAENPKVLFIKLADRTHNMRTIYTFDKEHQMELIEETKKIIIPIAHRLGIKTIKSELEDLCLKYSKPEVYQDIRNMINASNEELTYALNKMKEEISLLLENYDIKFEIMGRVKSVYGIYCKLDKGRKFNDIFDLLGLRVLVDRIEDCYLVIGLIHSKYHSIPKRFKDFIANPKSNMYQSVHTTVFGVDNRMFEVQVRTHEMDEIAEKGVASHWSYKEHTDAKVKSNMENRLETFRSLIEANDSLNNEEFFSHIEEELNTDEIYVFTPKGDIIELPTDSTPIDFAYRIHSEVGNTCVGAIVNDNIVKLDYKLNDGDIVSLLTKSSTAPSKSWLKFVKTNTAKSRIKSYFSKQEKEKLIKTGEEMLNAYIKKQKLNKEEVFAQENIKRLFSSIKTKNMEEVYTSISSLKYTPTVIVNRLLGINEDKKENDSIKKIQNIKEDKNNNIIVGKEKDILTNIASCCNPVYGEDIIGYVTKGNGVSIHRSECKNIGTNNERVINVSWSQENTEKYRTYLNIYTTSVSSKLVDIVNLASTLEINVESIKEIKNYYEIICKVKSIDELNKFIISLESIKNITKVERISKNESSYSKK